MKDLCLELYYMWGMLLMHGGKCPGADCDSSSISTEYVSSLLVTEYVSSLFASDSPRYVVEVITLGI